MARGHGAGRVIAGTARGIGLAAPGTDARPLGDRVKQTLFAVLEPDLPGRAFLDLFAGSGAAGIEALSRGASRATFVERVPAAIRAIEANLAATHLGEGSAATIARAEALAWLEREARAAGPFGAALVDPPYDSPDQLRRALELVAAAGPDGILDADGVVVAKHFWRDRPPARIGLLRSARERRFGETALTFYRWAGEEER